MLILKIKKNDPKVVFVDRKTKKVIGTIERFEKEEGRYVFGFDFPESIQILRGSLLEKKQ